MAQTGHSRANQARGYTRYTALFDSIICSYRTVLGLAVMLSVASAVWYTGRGLALASPDAAGYLLVARSILYGHRPGLLQLGNQALPLHYLLMLPFVWNYALWQSGLAGIIPSMVAYTVCGVYGWRLGYLCFGRVSSGWAVALVMLLNPTLLYLQATPFPDLELLAAVIVAIFYATLWSQTRAASDLVLAALATSAATLLQLSGWIFAVILLTIVLYSAWQRHDKSYVEACGLLFGLVAFTGGALWLAYQWIIYGNPLQPLLDSTSLALWYAPFVPAGRDLGSDLQHLGGIALATIGWPLALFLPAALIRVVILPAQRTRLAPSWALLAPVAGVLAQLAYASMRPSIAVTWPGNMLADVLNPRAVLLALPIVALLLAGVAALHRWLLGAALSAIVVTLVLSFFVAATPGQQTVESGTAAVEMTEAVRVGGWLALHDHGGHILISVHTGAPALFYAHVPLDSAITEVSGPVYRTAVAHPERYASWLVMDAAPGDGDPVWLSLRSRQDWRPYFKLRQVIGSVYIYQRTGNGNQP